VAGLDSLGGFATVNLNIIVDWVLIVGFACFVCIPMIRSRIRSPWANWVFVGVGITGFAMSAFKLAIDMQWLVLDPSTADRIHQRFHFIRGLLLGFIFSLIASRQLFGIKRDDTQSTQKPGA
jgi:hypothetical protein